MHVRELVLDGFKSYPVRTSINGWDPSFNAITGLNGSGKSNILDAICFVLGLTNMSSMRAQNQQDLIYKRGQAGVTRASVTIVFDNTDTSKSPPAYEGYEEIAVTRKIFMPSGSSYLLNGHKATQQQVQSLFQSVQLNINNPNFLIMQGRITKVLNMRPQEILSMVEEAAGTRMFEDRKADAFKKIAKKEKKVQDILNQLATDITPDMDKLREEKRSYLAYQKTCSELERIGRTLRAWDWTDAKARVTAKAEEIEANQNASQQAAKDIKQMKKEIAAAEKTVEEVTAQRDKELKKGGKFKKLEEDVIEQGKALAKIKTQVEIKNDTLADEEAKLATAEQELEQLRASLEKKRAQVGTLTTSHGVVKDKHAALQTALNNAEELLQTLLTGLSNKNTTTGGGYMGQLADAKQRAAHANAEEDQSKVKLSMAEKELKSLEARWKEVEREAGESTRNLQAMRAEIEGLRKKVDQTGWSAEKEQQAELALRNAREEVRRLSETRDNIKRRMGNLDFEFESPTPNFDRSKVQGLVATLVGLKQGDYNKATALEITAGGRLYNVVVSSDEVGKQILQNGRLKKRVTLIPLNKIQAYHVPDDKVDRAESATNGNANLAINLISYPNDVKAAMEYVFGSTFVCNDADTAKRITFDKQLGVGVKSVTLDGDVYDPSGTLSGGAAPTSNAVLVKVQELLEAEDQLNGARGRLSALEQEQARFQGAREKWKSLARELDIKEHQMKLLEEQVGGSNAARVKADVDQAKKTIEEHRAAIQSAKDKYKAAQEECKKLERDMQDFKNNKEGKIDELKADVSKQKAALQKHSVIVKTQQKELQTAALELEQHEADITTAEAELEASRVGLKKLIKDLEKSKSELKAREDACAVAEKKLQDERATLSRFDDELKSLDHAIKVKKEGIQDAELKISTLKHDLATLEKDRTAAENSVAKLEKLYEWIAEEQGQFGKSGTPYDFKKANIGQLRKRAEELEEQQKGMKKKINTKVINMLEDLERREQKLKSDIATVLGDKQKIEDTIAELDRYKRDALEKTWKKVNGDFGGIFAELLPGNFAKLQPPEGQDLMQGLEVKVRLGTVWKESLTELSGGQRSLIALSLIMSLLQFKPAPMYILDEIDAALDLSHTQHIGQLFRTRFKGSQFVVVSLKEGLFTNANVLFRTRFRDGTSIVERTAQRSTSALYQA